MPDLPYDPTTPVGMMRSMIPDRAQIENLMTDGSVSFIFSDDDLNVYLTMNGGNIRRACADALEILGTNEMMVGKVITTQDLVTDTSKLMAQYLARAAMLRAQADKETGMENVDDSISVINTNDPYPDNKDRFYGFNAYGAYIPYDSGYPGF